MEAIDKKGLKPLSLYPFLAEHHQGNKTLAKGRSVANGLGDPLAFLKRLDSATNVG